MPNTCEKCAEVFYSDTEFREHKLFEVLEDLLKRAINSSSGIYWQAVQTNILKYAELTRMTPNDAIIPYAQWAIEAEEKHNDAYRKIGRAK